MDHEKLSTKGLRTSSMSGSSTPSPAGLEDGKMSIEQARPGRGSLFMESFRRDERQVAGLSQDHVIEGKAFDVEAVIASTASSPLARKLKGRHLQMIAIGGSIGTGLFVGSGKALAVGGPGSLLIAYGLISAMLFFTVHALGELAVMYPIAGSFSAFATRFLDPAWGFAMGWNYALQWLVTLPLELVAASIVIEYWNDAISPAVFITVFLVAVTIINLFGVKGYGEAEYVFSMIKVIAVIGFIILGIVLNIGGGPQGGYIGGQYFHNPGSFNAGFKGLCSVFVIAAFSFSGTELVGLAAAETENPRKSLPKAVKQVFWRIVLFYMVSVLLVGLLVPYTDPRLLVGNSASASASPFVIAIQDAGISVLPSIMNAVILISVLSVGNSSVYGSSRTLAALADQRQAPQILGYIDRAGRPLVGIAVSMAFGLIAYSAVSASNGDVFSWLLALSGLSSIFTWLTICLCHIRFRSAWKLAGRSLDEIAFRAQTGVTGSWLGFLFNSLVFVAQFWIGFSPVGYAELSTSNIVINFFQLYLAAPIIIISGFAYKFWFKTKFVAIKDMDLDTGIRELDLSSVLAAEREEARSWPRWKRIYKFLC